MTRHPTHILARLLALAALSCASATSMAAEYWLCTAITTKIMPDTGEIVVMWGYAQDNDNNLVNGCGNAVTIPGPLLTVLPGDNSLTIHLRNGLAEPVSIVIPGQIASMVPVRNPDGRVRSFTHETAPGGTADYVWPNLKPGTYAYHSGTHPAVHVQMGLYGAIKHDAALGQAYPGVPYDQDVVVYYSEVDPVLHRAVESNNYGPAKTVTSTIDYNPRYFLVNGEPYSAATLPLPAGSIGQRTLLRFINMGLESHVPVLQGMHMNIVAEDGNAFAYPREQYSLMLAASKTKDALITPVSAGRYPLYDRMLALTNHQASPGGLLSLLQVAGASNQISDTVTLLRTEFNSAGLNVWATSTNPAATLSVTNPVSNISSVMGPLVIDSGVLNGGYHQLTLPIPPGATTVTVTSNAGGSDSSAVPFSKIPVANSDSYTTLEDTALTIAPVGVLTNDLKGGWLLASHQLQAVITTPPSNGKLVLNANGSLTYTPNANVNGADSFTYVAKAIDTVSTAVLASSAPALVTLNITPVNDAPVSTNDAYSMFANRVLSIAARGVLANDFDAEGSALTAAQVTGPSNGVLILNTNGAFSYTPAPNFTGIDSFTYRASDGVLSGTAAVVTITVNPAPNSPPVAVDDFATIQMNIASVINVLANDTDVDNNINPASVTITTQPSRSGTVSVNAVTGSVTFTPARNFRGTDLFRYRVGDRAGALSNIATVRINVTR